MFLLFILLSFTATSNAGFLSQFFANVASDSLKGNGKKGHVATDPVIREKKMQGALGAMGYYHQFPDGDLNTFESRIAIKGFQKFLGSEPTGMLLDTEKEQLLYLSNLYVELKKENISQQKEYAIYNEIDSTIDAMKHQAFYQEYLNYFDSTEKLRVISQEEDALVYINGLEVGKILLGYVNVKIEPGIYELKIEKFTTDGEWQLTSTKSIEVKEDIINISKVTLSKRETKQRKDRIAKELAQAKESETNELKILKAQGIEYTINLDGTITDFEHNLVWMRCTIEQMWNGHTCLQDPDYKNIDTSFKKVNTKAAAAGQQKWRIPTINELTSLVYCSSGKPAYRNLTEKSCQGNYRSPTIAQSLFPNTPVANFWSSTIIQDFMFRRKAKFINFDKGYAFKDSSGEKSKVRLVKSLINQNDENLTTNSNSSGEYSDVFHDKNNHLVWEDSSKSAEQKKTYTNAKKHCQTMTKNSKNKWRLPSTAELATLFSHQNDSKTLKNLHDFRSGQHYLVSNIENMGFDFKDRGNTKIRSTNLHFRCVYEKPDKVNIRHSIAKKYNLPIYSDNIVVDLENHLAWENNLTNESKYYSPQKAKNRCENLNIDGINNWQVPDSKQLRMFFKQSLAYSTAKVVSEKIGFLSIKRDYAYKLNNKGKKTDKSLLADNNISAHLICVKPLSQHKS